MHRIGRARIYLAIAAVVIIECTLLNALDFRGLRPDLLLILVIFIGLNTDLGGGFEAGAASGLLRGIMSSGSVGTDVVLLGLVGLAAAFLKNKVFKDSALTQIALTAIVAVFYNLAILFVRGVFSDVSSVGIDIQHKVAYAVIYLSAYTALVAPPVFFCLKRALKVRE